MPRGLLDLQDLRVLQDLHLDLLIYLLPLGRALGPVLFNQHLQHRRRRQVLTAPAGEMRSSTPSGTLEVCVVHCADPVVCVTSTVAKRGTSQRQERAAPLLRARWVSPGCILPSMYAIKP